MAERAFPAAPVAAFGGSRIIASPFQFALTDDDNLQIVSANSLAGVVLAVQGRRLSAQGTIEPFSFRHTPTSDRLTKTENFKLGAGALLNLTVFAESGSPMIGQTYVSARLIRGLSAATILLGGLLGGYLTAAQPLTYPGSPIIGSTDGAGALRLVDGTQPAPGVNISETVPTGARWELMAVRVDFTTAAGGANRAIRLFVDDGSFTRWRIPQPTTQAPSTVISHVFAPGIGTFFDAATNLASAPLMIPVPLAAGMRLQTNTPNLAAGDQWDQPHLVVREWLEVKS